MAILFTSSQSAFRFHRGVDRAQHKGQMNQNLDIFSFEFKVFIKYKIKIF